MKMLTRSMVRHAHAIAREVGARVIMLHADVIEEDAELSSLVEDVNFRIILVSHRPDFLAPVERKDMCSVVHVPDIAMTRAGDSSRWRRWSRRPRAWSRLATGSSA